jgi:hypothetical protein
VGSNPTATARSQSAASRQVFERLARRPWMHVGDASSGIIERIPEMNWWRQRCPAEK